MTSLPTHSAKYRLYLATQIKLLYGSEYFNSVDNIATRIDDWHEISTPLGLQVAVKIITKDNVNWYTVPYGSLMNIWLLYKNKPGRHGKLIATYSSEVIGMNGIFGCSRAWIERNERLWISHNSRSEGYLSLEAAEVNRDHLLSHTPCE